MNKIHITLISLLVLVTSCSIFQPTEKRAQRHLQKAISLDPELLKTTEKDSVRLLDSVVIKDSIRIKDSIDIRIKDSTIIIPKSDLSGDISEPCDTIKGLKPFSYYLGSGVHRLHIWSDGKTIKYSSTVDELVSTIRSKDTYIEHLEDSLHSKETIYKEEIARLKNSVVTVIKYKPTTWQVIKITFISLFAGLLLGYIIAKLTKFKLPFLP